MEKLNNFFRMLMLLIIGCLSVISAKAQSVEIQGLTPVVENNNGNKVYRVQTSYITVSSSAGKFDGIYIDGERVEYNSASYWDSYTLNVASYLDGSLHLLELKSGSSHKGMCYFSSAETISGASIDGVIYFFNGEEASVFGSSYGIEEANILSLFSKDGVDYPVVSIFSDAFNGCDKLHTVTIPESVTSIGQTAFYGCSSLNSITIPESVTSIGNWVFGYCTSLNSITIPESVTSIGQTAFYGCTSLNSITIPESVTSIGDTAFGYCSSLTSLTFKAINCGYCGSWDYPAFPSTISNLTIGNGVTKIPDYFLYNGSQIESLTIPNTVTMIGKSAFFDNTNLKSLTLGSGLLSIGENAFSYNGNDYIKIQIPKVFWLNNTPPTNSDEVSASVNYVANDQYNLSNQVKYQFLSSKFEVDGTIYVPVSPSDRTCDVVDCVYSLSNGDITIGDKVINRGVELSVLNINDYSFYGNQTLLSLNVNNSGNIGKSAFYDCDVLTSVTAFNTDNIEEKAFYNCDALTTVTISNQGNIGDSAFYNCDALTSVTTSNQGNIGNSAFYDCDALTTVILNNKGDIGDKAFYDSAGSFVLKAGNIGHIESEAFAECVGLKEVEITSRGSINSSAFRRCTTLQKAVIDNVGIIGDYAFSGCKGMTDLVLGDSIISIGSYGFAECSSLPNIALPDNIESIGGDIFENCTSLASVKIGTGIEEIPEYTFANCSALNNVSIPNNVKTIGNSVFSGCSSLTNLTIEDGVQNEDGTTDILQLGSNGYNPMFSDSPLDVVYLGRKLSYNTSSYYGYSPFYRNASLRSVEVTDAETEIYDNEFYGCTNLKTLKIGNGVKKIGKWAFSGCSSLDYFSAGYNVETIGDEAFSDCTGLTNYYSLSIVPPVCGSQALDDINKWECTLVVPAESSDEYMAADQWKEFFFVNENNAVLIEDILLNAESLDGKTGDTFQLTADVLPVNATRKSVEWLSSNPDIVTVDANGLVTFVKEGEATITVSATDGSGVEATINVVVTIKEPALGDSNGNGLINVADAVNIANHAIGNVVEHINEKASDVNQDGVITLADATATISLILEQPVTSSPAFAPANVHNGDNGRDLLVIDDYTVRRGENMTVSVALENRIDYVAIQADVRVPEGMTLVGVNAGERCESTHSIVTRRIDSRTIRVALFDASNAAFADNDGALLELIVNADGEISGDIEINNIVASDSNAHDYMLASAGGHNSDISGVGNICSESVRIEPSAGTVDILNAEGCEVMIHAADGTMLRRFVAESDAEHITIVPGVYVVAAGNKVAKVIVK